MGEHASADAIRFFLHGPVPVGWRENLVIVPVFELCLQEIGNRVSALGLGIGFRHCFGISLMGPKGKCGEKCRQEATFNEI